MTANDLNNSWGTPTSAKQLQALWSDSCPPAVRNYRAAGVHWSRELRPICCSNIILPLP